MLVLYVIIVVCLALALVAALLFEGQVISTVLFFAALTLVGSTALFLVGKNRKTSKLRKMLRLYLRHTESLYDRPSARISYERRAIDFAQMIVNELGSQRVLLLARRKSEFVCVESFGIDRAVAATARISVRDEIISRLESAPSVMEISRLPATSKGVAALAKHRLSYLIPIISNQRCCHIVAISESQRMPVSIAASFLLAIADQIGVFRQIEELRNRSTQQLTKLKRELHSRENQLAELSERDNGGSSLLLEAQDRLIGVFDADRLHRRLLKLIEKRFKCKFCLVLFPNEKSSNFEVQYHLKASQELREGLALQQTSPILESLRQSAKPTQLSALRNSLPHEPVIAELTRFGDCILALISGRQANDSLIVIGMGKQTFSEQECQELHSLGSLFGLVLADLEHFSRIEELSYTDYMTGLYNYRYFYKRIKEEILRAKRFDRHLALVIFDIDGFKVFNDTYGHQAGDQLLKQLGDLLLSAVRTIDVVSRYGGEEFCIIMPETNVADCASFMERLRLAILNTEFDTSFSKEPQRITVSLGGAIYPNDAQRVDRLIYCADMALLQAKNSGRNKSFMFDEKVCVRK